MTASVPKRRTKTARAIAEKLGCNPRTVRKWMAMPRAEYLEHALTRAKPWEAVGMSRASWYRHGKPSVLGTTNVNAPLDELAKT